MALVGRRMLIILDDVWDASDMRAYQVGGQQCQYLLTTRQTALAHRVCAVVYRPELLSTAQALHVLSSDLPPHFVHEHRSALLTAAQQVENLPLALEWAARYLRHEASTDSQRRISEAIAQLIHAEYFLQNEVREPNAIYHTIQRSIDWLSFSTRQALLCLATTLPATPAVWTEYQASELLKMQELPIQELDHLLDTGLIDAAGNSCYQIHPIIRAYAWITVNSTSQAPPVC